MDLRKISAEVREHPIITIIGAVLSAGYLVAVLWSAWGIVHFFFEQHDYLFGFVRTFEV